MNHWCHHLPASSFLITYLLLVAGPYVGFYFGGGLKIRGGERRGPKGRSPRSERPAPSPPSRGSGERCKLPSIGLLHFVDARWLFLAFQRLLAKHQRPNIMEHVIFIQWENFSCYNFGGGGWTRTSLKYGPVWWYHKQETVSPRDGTDILPHSMQDIRRRYKGMTFWNATAAFPSLTPFRQDLLSAPASQA